MMKGDDNAASEVNISYEVSAPSICQQDLRHDPVVCGTLAAFRTEVGDHWL